MARIAREVGVARMVGEMVKMSSAAVWAFPLSSYPYSPEISVLIRSPNTPPYLQLLRFSSNFLLPSHSFLLPSSPKSPTPYANTEIPLWASALA